MPPLIERAMPRSLALVFGLLLGGVLLLAWLAYHPGLSGSFLFDDFANLPSLGAFGRVDNLPAFLRYATSGGADPTGRPLSVVSFLLDANDWPADPFRFKRTNVLLHLLNGALLAWLLLLFGRATGRDEARCARAALLGMALWLLHPFLVSTTLYVVQREAMLPATFVLAGLIGYVKGRQRIERGQSGGFVLAGAAVLVGTALATLSKGNGILLPLLAWLVEALLLAPLHPLPGGAARRRFALFRRLLLVLPSILLGLYLLQIAYSGFVHGLGATRPWTLGQRLLTEPRILIDYLQHLWLPRPYSAGLFNDQHLPSQGLFSPISTLASLALVFGLLAFAWRIRRSHPPLALAILFFFAGHLLESTVIPLELYFEHRNYLPALLLFWPLALWLGDERRSVKHRRGNDLALLQGSLTLLLPLGLAFLTYLHASLWGNVRDQALLWAKLNPDSPRAQGYAAQLLLARGEARRGAALLEAALARLPNHAALALNLIGARCASGGVSEADLARGRGALSAEHDNGRLGYEWFEQGMAQARNGSCPGLDLDALETLVDAAMGNPIVQEIHGRRQDMLDIKARIALLRGRTNEAAVLFRAALDADPRPGAALNEAAALATAGAYDEALRLLDRAQAATTSPRRGGFRGMIDIHRGLMRNEDYWPREFAHLRQAIQRDLAARDGAAAAPTPERSGNIGP